MGRRGRNNLIDESIFFVTTTVIRFRKVFINQKYKLIQNMEEQRFVNNILFKSRKMVRDFLAIKKYKRFKRALNKK